MKPTNLINLRKARGLTQSALAEQLGISRGRYSLYELGLRKLPVDLALRIADVLGVSVRELFEPDHSSSQATKTA